MRQNPDNAPEKQTAYREQLAKILGHASLKMVAKYVHPQQADVDRAMEMYAGAGQPLDRMEAEGGVA